MSPEPGPGHRPVAGHRARRYTQCAGRLLLAQSTKKAALHHQAEPRIHRGEPLERLIERQQLRGPLGNGEQAGLLGLIEGQRPSARTAPSLGPVFPRVVHQDATHDPGGDGEEVLAINPLGPHLILELEIGFVNQGRRAQGVADGLRGELPMGDTPELIVDQGKETFEALRSATPQHGKRGGDLLLLRLGHDRHLENRNRAGTTFGWVGVFHARPAFLLVRHNRTG